VAEKKGRNNFYVYLLFIVAIVFVVASLFLAFGERPLQVEEFDVRFRVTNGTGSAFDINNSLLVFGKTTPGGTGIKRYVNITNSYDFPIRTDVFVSEHIASVILTNSSYWIESGEQKEIPVRLQVHRGFSLGNYTGKIRFELYKDQKGLY